MVTLTYPASTDLQSGVKRYEIQRNGVRISSTTETKLNDKTVAPETTYEYRVRAIEVVGNVSAFSRAVTVNVPK